MAVEEDGRIHETVGGGAGEYEVMLAARRALESDRPELVRFDMKGEGSGGGAMVCGGSMEILVEPLAPSRDAAWVRALVRLREDGSRALLLRMFNQTPISASSVLAVMEEGNLPAWTREGVALPELPLAPPAGVIDFLPGPEPGREYAVESIHPVERLVIVGGGHIGKALCAIASLLRYEVTLVDERKEFADPERFPDATRVICGDPGEAMKTIPAGEHAHFVLVSHRFPSDLEALRALARKKARYIGMIGSKRRVETVLRALRAEGVDPSALERLHAPIGLDIGGETPEEIAVSIMAEIIAVRSGMGRGAGSLSGGGRTK
jgi:xanthine dehydrogenase accessory factor